MISMSFILFCSRIATSKAFCVSGSQGVMRKRAQLLTRHLTVNIYVVGKKSPEEWISNGVMEYETRLKSIMNIETNFLKSDDALVSAVSGSRGVVLAMDETGQQYTSKEFSELVFKSFEEGGSHISFVVGGFD